VTGVFNSLVAPFQAERSAAYTLWNIGATYTAFGIGFDLRWADTDIEATHPVVQELYALQQSVESRVVFSIKKAL
jgi:hypothetical protein